MVVLLKHSISWQVSAEILPEIQLILIVLSIIVVIAALLFAGYILIRDNRHVKPEIPSSIEQSPAIHNDNDSLPKNTSVQPVKEQHMTDTPVKELPITSTEAKEHLMTNTPVIEQHMTGIPVKEHPKTNIPVKEHPVISTSTRENQLTRNHGEEYKPLSFASPATNTRANLKISGFKIVPSNLKAGELVTIWLTATNLDSRQVSHEIILRINNQVFNTRIISILPGTIQHLHFKVAITEPGSYTADVNGITGTFAISE